MVCSEDARTGELDVSLLERLFERPLYIPKRRQSISSLIQSFPELSVNNKSSSSTSTNSSLIPSAISKPRQFTNLVKVSWPFNRMKMVAEREPCTQNYRSHPVILMPPSAMFYNDTLQPCANNGAVIWSGLSAPHLPVKFIGHNHPEATNDEVSSIPVPKSILSSSHLLSREPPGITKAKSGKWWTSSSRC